MMAGWGLGCALLAVTIAHFEEVRAALGLKLSPEDFGVAASPQSGSGAADGEASETAEQDAAPPASDRTVVITRGSDGHFHADASINGRTFPVLIDTGATAVVLTHDDAKRAGITVGSGDYRYVSNTANGQARFARVTLREVRVGGVSVRNVDAAISQPGLLSTSLLGMSFLGQLRMEMKGKTLLLEQ